MAPCPVPQAAATFFTGVCALIVLGFLGFQLYLICTGGTRHAVPC